MPLVPRPLALGILLVIASVQPASGDPILVTDGRVLAVSALTNAQPPTVVVKTPMASFSPFVETATANAAAGSVTAQTIATQRSSIGPALFAATGTIDSAANTPDGLDGFAFANGSSTFEIEFDLGAAYRYALTGLISVDGTGEGGGFGEAEVSLGTEQVSGGTDVVQEADIRFGSQLITVTGVLPAGRQRLFMEASTESVANAGRSHHGSSFSLDLALTPTPESTTVSLVGGGLLILAARKFRQGVGSA